MTAALARMLVQVRRELVAWALAGAALHWIVKSGFNRWNMASLGVSLGIGATARNRARKPQN